ncbi:MAG: chorismate synthase [Clostridiales bacterium]|nr:chorismate synthase [Clostridiales bacterium]
MNSTWGKNIIYSLFGESHGTLIGITIHHLPAGIKLNLDDIQLELNKRRPGKDVYLTSRDELDEFEIVSGYFNKKTTGAPLTAIIKNTSQRSSDYKKSHIRPSHADYAAYVKYDGYNDYRGGGHFSGRLTAPIVFAGAIAKQLLEKKNIKINACIVQIGKIKGDRFNDLMQNEIINAKKDGDSVGGVVQVVADNVPAGIGEPFFNSIESVLSQLFYSIPAVKGVTFGLGINFANEKGSVVNDELRFINGEVVALSNNNGGITGGISNGMPIVSRLYFKPTPSIMKIQRTIDIETKENIENSIKGRHDPCIVPRALPVTEAMMAIGLLEMYMDYEWSKRWHEDD